MKQLKLVIIITLVISCLTISFLTIIVGSVGTFGKQMDNDSLQEMYYLQLVPITELGKANEMFQRQRAIMREMIIGAVVDDLDMIETARERADRYHDIMQEALDNYWNAVRSEHEMRLFQEARYLYDIEFRGALMRIYESAKMGVDVHELYSIMRECTPAIIGITDNFDQSLDLIKEKAERTMQYSENTGNIFSTIILSIMILILIINIGVTVFLSLYTSFTIKKLGDSEVTRA